jgi:hypothetical protein
MAKVWVLDTETKGTGAHVAPLEDAAEPGAKQAPRRKQRASRPPGGDANRRRPAPRPETKSSPLPQGHVRKKSTGEIGRVRSVDARAGTATVLWLKQGRTSTVPLTAISRR